MNIYIPRFRTLFLAILLLGTQVRVRANLPETDPFKGKFATKGDRFAIWDGRDYVPLFIKGINMGISVPGTLPGQLAATREDYRRWFRLIREAGYNTMRLYTLHYPWFYEELETFNLEHQGDPLLVIQGIWLEENDAASDLFEQSASFGTEIREVVRAVHGDIQIDQRFGRAYGSYTADISSWVIGYLPGREVYPAEVKLTNELHPGINAYTGEYFSLEGGGDPAEVWVCRQLDSLQIFEAASYGTVRPTGFSTWPTLDPLEHPTEDRLTGSDEDKQQIDLSNLDPSESSAGFFIGYHAYPYYPDFIVQDPEYRAESDSVGPNSYLGYLKALKARYMDTPLLIAEFGVPTSWGIAHLTPSGMHHGGISEEEQGRYTIRMLDNMREANCAGGIQFSLIDEWFKQTWITNPLSDKSYRHYWHNITSPEQNFGILSYDPPPARFVESGSFPGSSVSGIKLASDYTFFRIRIYLDAEQYPDDTIWIGLDTYDRDLGESILPDGTSIGRSPDTLRAEFALGIPLNGNRADLYVIPSYDIYGIKDPVRLDTVVSSKSDAGFWNIVRWKTNYFYQLTQYVGQMSISGEGDPYGFLHSVTKYRDSLDIRIPWTLINFPAPSVGRAMHYISYLDGEQIVVEQKDTLTDGIAVTISLGGNLYPSDRYSWSPWDHELIARDPPIERKKRSYHYLKQWLPVFNSPPIGWADSFEIWPGNPLEVSREDGLLSNDFDVDGNQFYASLSFGSNTLNGHLHLHPDGSFLYDPREGFIGDDFFMYYLDDGRAYSSLVPVHIRVGFPLSGEESIRDQGSRVFPNPGDDLFYLCLPAGTRHAVLRIVDVTGREVLFNRLTETCNRIYLGEADPGVYLFYVEMDESIETHRIIKR